MPQVIVLEVYLLLMVDTRYGSKYNQNSYLVGIDIGTSTTKVTIIDLKGNIVFSDSQEYSIDYLDSGMVQQNPDDWFYAATNTIKIAFSDNNIETNKVLAIGISSQSNALVPVDKKGNVLHPAIHYLDKRSADICNSFNETDEEKRIYEIGGSTLKPSYTGPQISWVKKNLPDVYKNTDKFLTANGYIIFKFTDEYSQDHTQTGMTGIYERAKQNWSEELLKYFDIGKNKLPDEYKAHEIVGKTNNNFKRHTDLANNIPVIAGSLDVASTMLGSGCIEKGSCFIEMGSVLNITVLEDRILSDRNLQTYPSTVPDINIIAGSIDGAGNTIRWFIDNIYKGYGVSEKSLTDEKILYDLEKEMESTNIGSDNLIFLPFMAGMRTPRSDLKSKGAFLGLKVSHKKIDIYRSILEGCSYGLKHNLEYILAKNIKVQKAIISGGASKNKFWVQMISDVLDIDIIRSSYSSGASIGSAMLAGIGVGAFRSFREAVKKVCRYDNCFKPEKKKTRTYNGYYKQYKDFVKNLILQLDSLEKRRNDE